MTVSSKAKILMTITMAAVFLFLYSNGVSYAAADMDDQYGVYYRHGRVFGKIIQYDPARDLVVVFGSVFVSEPGGQWRLVESRKFHLVNPVGNDLRQTLAAAVGRTVGVEGQLKVWPGQKEEVVVASKVDFQDYRIDTPLWYAFGVTVRPEKIYKFNLNSVNDFVNVLSGLRQAADIPQNVRLTGDGVGKLQSGIAGYGDRELIARVRNEFEEKWNEKWCVTRDNQAANQLRVGVGGWQFYQGLLGYGNCYVSGAPVVRRDIIAFMNAVRPGGGTPEESGQAVMCAYVTVERDRSGQIVRAMASGALYDIVPDLIGAMKNSTGLNLETWRLEGWGQEAAEAVDGKLCWLSGSRVLVYETDQKTGRSHLVDQYFSMDRYLTRDGFDNVLDVYKGVIGEGVI
ncbi:MAG: hypothetical protein ACOY46_18820 [Bacillota bacterium]